MKKVNIFTNGTKVSESTRKIVTDKLEDNGFIINSEYSEDTDLLICIGGDGAFLQAVHTYGFPSTPIIGINTGHLGFFQEVLPTDLDRFVEEYKRSEYRLQPLNMVQATVTADNGEITLLNGLNEIVIKGNHSYSIHLNISIGGSPIERFSGDGLLFATSAGSTAYNYSLGGSIVDPRIKLLQVTPIAPMNTTAYRSFTSSILLPSDLSLEITPEFPKDNDVIVMNDGIENIFTNPQEIIITVSDTIINLLRFASYDFWDKVKAKFLLRG